MDQESVSIIPPTQDAMKFRRPPLATQARSSTTYNWVILFLWHLSEEFPFSVVPLDLFRKKRESDFPMHLITGPLSDKSRMNQYKLVELTGNIYSVFCKIEVGVCLK